MSIQSARDFLTKVAKDKKFRAELVGCRTEAERQEFALKAGFQFTSNEIAAARTELQDADLDGISGGTGCAADPWYK